MPTPLQKSNAFSHRGYITQKCRMQLGHPTTGKCPVPVPAFNDSFVIIDSDGIHEVALDFCGCGQSISKVVQLLRARLFPSTVIDPKTAATFRVLETFQMLTFTSKISGYEFYCALARRTDNTGTRSPPDRYQAFMRMIREWRHVRMLKRAGRGHDIAGVKGTKLGECAVICPACPMPGINLLPNWRERPVSDRWLDTLFIGIDANFRLKRMNVSSDKRDPGLNHGYAYIVEESAFKAYLEQYDRVFSDDKSTCNKHDAIKSASIRGGRGTAASGLGTIECSRHDMKRPIAVGDLQKGECLSNNSLERLVVSYDIACQWSKNLHSRSEIYPSNFLSMFPDTDIEFLVPKFHLPAHVIDCQLEYSFNLVPKVGRTDGEAPERGWAAANAVATSTREMGPGSRRDVLDDHFGDYNWRKIIDIGRHFLRKSEDAVTARQEHVEAFIEFDAALPVTLTAAWTVLCQTWERDRSKTNPFRAVGAKMSEAEVRLKLAQEDEESPAIVKGIPAHFSMTPSYFIYQGLDIEDQQTRLGFEISNLGPHSTALQQAKVLERSNALRRRIESWIEIQHFYLPALVTVRARLEEAGGGKPISVEYIELFLPSQIHDSVMCPLPFLRYEWQFRCARAEEALNDLRGQILMRTLLRNSKQRHSRGQVQQTRSTKLLNGVDARVSASATKYRSIRTALTSLSVPLVEVSWVNELRVLEDSDLVGLTSFDDGGPEGRKKLSWIWKGQGIGSNTDASGQEALRIEWCKSRARAHRWQEECLLLDEEMKRVLTTFRWQNNHWLKVGRDCQERDCVSAHTVPALNSSETKDLLIAKEGMVAYANRQAEMRLWMIKHCEATWKDVVPQLRSMEGGHNVCIMIEHVG
ncbi:hypothetical protein BDN70DRAFT_939144 [Pholiota conissans]|uniref:CxC2-like cysteine cluster KDZ transposase-associated domain-containing protein n=1 Tax=Pholiota conissans TaxID=109636 RepID=A0A9P5YJW4_9AGAR|nr:hypothetical protein BDN70DRAFT_939144 [Pholiota conissans]